MIANQVPTYRIYAGPAYRDEGMADLFWIEFLRGLYVYPESLFLISRRA